MLLIADSGSTKCDWIFKTGTDSQQRFQTIGFNPFFHNSDQIFSEIHKNSDLINIAPSVRKLVFYGAGISSPEREEIVASALRKIFSNATIEVDHDMIGAVHATCGNDPGIACILGTGSNSCYFDGKTVSEKVPALGYILGDEGSGSWLGKGLLRDYLYHDLPHDLETKFVERYKMDKEHIFERIYRKPGVNVFLASFAPFLAENVHEQYVHNLAKAGFNSFIKIHVCKFDNYLHLPVHFVGSIAFHFRSVLQEVCKENQLHLGTVTNDPATHLFEYHLKTL